MAEGDEVGVVVGREKKLWASGGLVGLVHNCVNRRPRTQFSD